MCIQPVPLDRELTLLEVSTEISSILDGFQRDISRRFQTNSLLEIAHILRDLRKFGKIWKMALYVLNFTIVLSDGHFST